MMHAKHKGAANELGATLWLMNQGYEVFRNVSAHGVIDIIAVRGEEFIKIDVKAATIRVLDSGVTRVYPSGKEVAPGVRMLCALPGGVFGWQEDVCGKDL